LKKKKEPFGKSNNIGKDLLYIFIVRGKIGGDYRRKRLSLLALNSGHREKKKKEEEKRNKPHQDPGGKALLGTCRLRHHHHRMGGIARQNLGKRKGDWDSLGTMKD